MSKKDSKLMFLSTAFGVLFVLANILATKQIYLFGLAQDAGIFVFPITFLITDIVNEVYGSKVAQKLVNHGFILMVVVLGFIQFAIWYPGADFWHNQEAFATTFGSTFRITLGSLAAFFISQSWDVWMFDWIKRVTKGRHLWIRNNVSTITANMLDSVVFTFIAFWGVVPNSAVYAMIVGAWVLKFGFALLDTPFCYWGVKWVRKGGEKLWT